MLNTAKKGAVGLDIADRSIEVIELSGSGKKLQIASLNRLALPAGVVEKGFIKNQDKLARAVRKVLAEAKPEPITSQTISFSLPESIVETHVFNLARKTQDAELSVGQTRPQLDNPALDARVEKEAVANLNLAADDLLFSYKILRQQKTRTEILVIGASQRVVLDWQHFFGKLGFAVDDFDIEILAIFRGLYQMPTKQPICVLDLGAATTNIAIFNSAGVYYTYSYDLGGTKLTQALRQELKLDQIKAEEKKKKVDLDKGKDKAREIIAKALEPLLQEIQVALNYFNKKTSQAVQEIILVGGTSQLKGLAKLLAQGTDLPVKLGQPVINLSERTKDHYYITALGTALRSLDPNWSKLDPMISLKPRSKAQPAKAVASLTSELKPLSEDIEPEDKPQKPPAKPQVKPAPPVKTKSAARAEALAQVFEASRDLSESPTSNLQPAEPRRKRGLRIALIGIIVIIAGVLAYTLISGFISTSNLSKEGAPEYTLAQTLELVLPITVNETAADGQVQGRLVELEVEAESYALGVNNSLGEAVKEVEVGERLWPDPVSPSPIDESTQSFKITYLIYSEARANSLILGALDEINTQNIDFAIDNVEPMSLRETGQAGLYNLTIEVTLGLNEALALPGAEAEVEPETIEKAEEPTPAAPQKLIEVTETPTDFLNVRSGPSTDDEILTKIFPGEQYTLLEVGDNWYKIEYATDQEGWVYAVYAEIVE